jgi:hypothetical protein
MMLLAQKQWYDAFSWLEAQKQLMA